MGSLSPPISFWIAFSCSCKKYFRSFSFVAFSIRAFKSFCSCISCSSALNTFTLRSKRSLIELASSSYLSSSANNTHLLKVFSLRERHVSRQIREIERIARAAVLLFEGSEELLVERILRHQQIHVAQ